jgi:hypothetical protein
LYVIIRWRLSEKQRGKPQYNNQRSLLSTIIYILFKHHHFGVAHSIATRCSWWGQYKWEALSLALRAGEINTSKTRNRERKMKNIWTWNKVNSQHFSYRFCYCMFRYITTKKKNIVVFCNNVHSSILCSK